jgi:hypothetical protein
VELRVTPEEAARLLASPATVDDLASDGGRVLLVERDPASPGVPPLAVPALLPAVVVQVVDGDEVPADAGGADVAAPPARLEALLEACGRNRQASAALAVLLRGGDGRTVADGLHAESAVYAVLQGGPEFARWRAEHPPTHPAVLDGDPVRVERAGDRLQVTLDRPELRNALDASMRDGLAAAFHLALADPTLPVELRGEGPAFCSGGYLDEFGTRPDPATAHLVRLARNLGWLAHTLSDRLSVRVQGPCRGSGVELAAFAGRVTARADTTFGLPEVAMGLIPGSGGTVSIARRIGRARTAWLALSGEVIDAPTALAWGLVDEITG